MSILTPAQRAFGAALGRIVYENPFLPERIEREREALGADFDAKDADWNVRADSEGRHANIVRLTERAASWIEAARRNLAGGARPDEAEARLYEDAVLFWLYHSGHEGLRGLTAEDGPGSGRVALYPRIRRDAIRCLRHPGLREIPEAEIAHLFACFFQIRRAFHHIFAYLIGSSPPAVRLRAAVWQSIFSRDLDRYRRHLFGRMADFTTLIAGPSGTGKELVARAIALSRYIPFDPESRSFSEDYSRCFHPVSLAALSPTLVESEIFGHRRGAFTGALEDHAGRLEVCPPLGTVFLDEVGEIDPKIQVKLLRVLQERAFERIGETRTLRFHGKIIAATHRDLAGEMREGRFRADLYYRICSDLVVTPSLHEQVSSDPAELRRLTRFVARRVAGEPGDALADEIVARIETDLGPDYPWPGNFRELEQCVRNILIRGEYAPARPPALSVRDRLADELFGGKLTADELLRAYTTLVYSLEGSYDGAARRLRVDRRTVRAKVDPRLLGDLRAGRPAGE